MDKFISALENGTIKDHISSLGCDDLLSDIKKITGHNFSFDEMDHKFDRSDIMGVLKSPYLTSMVKKVMDATFVSNITKELEDRRSERYFPTLLEMIPLSKDVLLIIDAYNRCIHANCKNEININKAIDGLSGKINELNEPD
jgi:hypothetical protein